MKQIVIRTTATTTEEAAKIIKDIQEKTKDLFPASPVSLEIWIK